MFSHTQYELDQCTLSFIACFTDGLTNNNHLYLIYTFIKLINILFYIFPNYLEVVGVKERSLFIGEKDLY